MRKITPLLTATLFSCIILSGCKKDIHDANGIPAQLQNESTNAKRSALSAAQIKASFIYPIGELQFAAEDMRPFRIDDATVVLAGFMPVKIA